MKTMIRLEIRDFLSELYNPFSDVWYNDIVLKMIEFIDWTFKYTYRRRQRF